MNYTILILCFPPFGSLFLWRMIWLIVRFPQKKAKKSNEKKKTHFVLIRFRWNSMSSLPPFRFISVRCKMPFNKSCPFGVTQRFSVFHCFLGFRWGHSKQIAHIRAQEHLCIFHFSLKLCPKKKRNLVNEWTEQNGVLFTFLPIRFPLFFQFERIFCMVFFFGRRIE